MGRLIGIDHGKRRIGLALADHGGRIASPYSSVDAAGSPSADAQVVWTKVQSLEPAGFIVGLPINMDGTEGPQAKLCRDFADALRRVAGLPVDLWDERLSSFQADQWLCEAEVPRSRRAGRRDALAAQVILQSYLDAARKAPPAPPNT